MIERTPTNTDKNTAETIDLEKGEDGVWRQLKEAALAEVDALISDLDESDVMTAEDKIRVLKTELAVIAGREDNSERYIFEELGKRIKQMELYEEVLNMESRIEALGGNIDVKA